MPEESTEMTEQPQEQLPGEQREPSLEEHVAQLSEVVAQQGEALLEMTERTPETILAVQDVADPQLTPVRLVLYHSAGMSFPAIVTDVYRSGAVRLVVFGMGQAALIRDSVMQGEEGRPLQNRWTWPPRPAPLPEIEEEGDEG